MGNVDFIKTYDFSLVTNKLVLEGLERAEAETAAEHLRIFMSLSAMYPGKDLAAWELQDKAWHAFMEDDPSYRAFCEQAFGGMITHNADAYGTPQFWAAWEDTRRLALKHFGLSLCERQPNLAAAACMFEGTAIAA